MIVKTVADYVDSVQEKFPDISKQDIRRAINFGFKSFITFNNQNCDVNIKMDDISAICGRLTSNWLTFTKMYKRKLIRKLHVLYKMKNVVWDGYYYFSLTDRQFNERFLSKKHKIEKKYRGVNFGRVRLYKMYDECKISRWVSMHIFRVPYLAEFGNTMWKDNYTPINCEYYEHVPRKRLRDILITEYKYDILNGNYEKQLRRRFTFRL